MDIKKYTKRLSLLAKCEAERIDEEEQIQTTLEVLGEQAPVVGRSALGLLSTITNNLKAGNNVFATVVAKPGATEKLARYLAAADVLVNEPETVKKFGINPEKHIGLMKAMATNPEMYAQLYHVGAKLPGKVEQMKQLITHAAQSEDPEELGALKGEFDKLASKWNAVARRTKETPGQDVSESAKPSAGLTKKEKSTLAKRTKKGEDVGKKGKNFEKVAAKAAKKYGSKEAGERVAAAAMWKARAKRG